MRKLYIHIGTYKTGSTAIQKALLQNYNFLKKEGILYIKNPQVSPLVKARTVNADIICEIREKLQHTINQYSNNETTTFIISFEGLSGHYNLGCKNANVVAESLKKITQNLFDDVYIIVYIRRQDDYLESLYTEMIHHGASHSFQEFIQKFESSSFNWDFLLKSYADCFGKHKLIVRRYHRKYLPETNSIFSDFAKIINSKSLESHVAEQNINAGYSRAALEIARLTNPYLSESEKYLLRRILQESNSKKPLEKYLFFTKDEREAIVNQYSESNSIVAKEYFNESSGFLFPPPNFNNDDEQVYSGLTSEDLAVIMARSMLLFKPTQESMVINFILLVEKRFDKWLDKSQKLKDVFKYLASKLGLLELVDKKIEYFLRESEAFTRSKNE